MRLLLDTHIFLWFLNGDPQLSQDFCNVIKDPKNSVYLSVASIWELDSGKFSRRVSGEKKIGHPIQKSAVMSETG
jgi:PIN domain nuclease of toxin-antitoxin system